MKTILVVTKSARAAIEDMRTLYEDIKNFTRLEYKVDIPKKRITTPNVEVVFVWRQEERVFTGRRYIHAICKRTYFDNDIRKSVEFINPFVEYCHGIKDVLRMIREIEEAAANEKKKD